jgi:dolichyl-phosphate beta-glucosyltransferase
MKIYLSVIIPCYNEEKNLKRGVLEEVENYLRRQKYASEVIITDDGSTDSSPQLVVNFIKNHSRFLLLKNRHAGKPFALKAGLQRAKGEIILFTDLDQSAPISELEKLLPWFKKNFALVIGSRGKERKHFSWYRKLISTGFRSFRRLILLPQIVDTQCGFKALQRQPALKIFEKMLIFKNQKKAAGWRVGAWDVEMLFIAQKMGYPIKEVRVDWQDKDVAQGKQRNYLKESKEMLTEVLRVRLNDLLGRYS